MWPLLSAMYGNNVLYVNVDVATLYLGDWLHLLPIARRQSGSPYGRLNSYPRAVLRWINVLAQTQFTSPNHVHIHAHNSWRQVMKLINSACDAVQCLWSGKVLQCSRHESIKTPFCERVTNMCMGRLSSRANTDSVCGSQGRQCQCRSCVQC